jgi:hypothetical protein
MLVLANVIMLEHDGVFHHGYRKVHEDAHVVKKEVLLTSLAVFLNLLLGM